MTTKTFSKFLEQLASEKEIISENNYSLSDASVKSLQKTLDSVFKKLKANSAFKTASKQLKEICTNALKKPTDDTDVICDIERTSSDSVEIYCSFYLGDYPKFGVKLQCEINRPTEDNTTLINIINEFAIQHNVSFENESIPQIQKTTLEIAKIMDKTLESELKSAHLEYEKYTNGPRFRYSKYYVTD